MIIQITLESFFQMDTSSDDSYFSDRDTRMKVLREPDPSNIDFYFLKTGKSKSEGVLITHGENFKFTKNNVNRNGTLHYYACALKQTHKCQSRAIIRRSVVTGEDGEDVVHNELLEVSTPEVY